MVAYLRKLADAGEKLHTHLETLQQAKGDSDPNEALHEQRFINRVDPAYYLEQETRTGRKTGVK